MRDTTATLCDKKDATNVTWHEGSVQRTRKEKILQQQGCVIWITGLSGSGKSTVACTLEHALADLGKATSLLDGDNIRHGLSSNLGFSPADREENIRRIGEVAKLFADSGILTIVSFISPYQKDRDRVRSRFRPGRFIEVHMRAPLSVCEQRDPKGLYRKARTGIIKGFTGIDDPYEDPEYPELVLEAIRPDGSLSSPEELALNILNYLALHGLLRASEDLS